MMAAAIWAPSATPIVRINAFTPTEPLVALGSDGGHDERRDRRDRQADPCAEQSVRRRDLGDLVVPQGRAA